MLTLSDKIQIILVVVTVFLVTYITSVLFFHAYEPTTTVQCGGYTYEIKGAGTITCP